MTADKKHKRVTEFEKGDKVLIEINRSSSMHGPVVVNHRGTEVALGYHLARKIIAERT